MTRQLSRKIKPDFNEVHERNACFRLSSQELREIVLDGIKRRGVDISGAVSIEYYACDFKSWSTPLISGPSVQVQIRQRLPK